MSGDKSEKPTAKRLRDSRKKGEVPFSKEVVSAVLMASFLGLLLGTAPTLVDRFAAIILMPTQVMQDDFSTAADKLLRGYLGVAVGILIPFLLIVIVGSIAGCTMQFGLLLSGESVKPSLKKMNPAQYFKKTFGMQNLVELLKSIIKISILGIILLILLRDGIQAMIRAPGCGMGCLRDVAATLLHSLAVWVMIPFVVIAAADLGYQRWHYTSEHKMSKDEVKREYKESEGDPMIKGQRKQLHQQLLAEGQVDRSRKASVLITNPTHVAVAIYYKPEETPLPVVTAMGTDLVARRMIEAAREAGVPVMQNVPLAHALLEQGNIDQYLPSELIEPFAEVLRALRELAAEVGAPTS